MHILLNWCLWVRVVIWVMFLQRNFDSYYPKLSVKECNLKISTIVMSCMTEWALIFIVAYQTQVANSTAPHKQKDQREIIIVWAALGGHCLVMPYGVILKWDISRQTYLTISCVVLLHFPSQTHMWHISLKCFFLKSPYFNDILRHGTHNKNFGHLWRLFF